MGLLNFFKHLPQKKHDPTASERPKTTSGEPMEERVVGLLSDAPEKNELKAHPLGYGEYNLPDMNGCDTNRDMALCFGMKPFFMEPMSRYEYERRLEALSEADKAQILREVEDCTASLTALLPPETELSTLTRYYDRGRFFVEYDAWRQKNSFEQAPHPLLCRYAPQPQESIRALREFTPCFNPWRIRVAEGLMKIQYNSGYVSAHYEETEEYILCGNSEHESYHDGGGSSSTSFRLTRAEGIAEPQTLLHSLRCNDLKMPPCRGYWIGEDGVCYLAEPFGLRGTFRLAMSTYYQEDYDSPGISKAVGKF